MPTRPAIAIHALQFQARGGRGIRLRDPATGRFLDESPEWQAPGRGVPAAFVRGSHPRVAVTFSGPPGVTVAARVHARGRGGPGILTRRLRLQFDSAGRSGPHGFRLGHPLPGRAGVRTVCWTWTASIRGRARPLGRTTHELLLAWRQPPARLAWATAAERAGRSKEPWAYLPVMRWTCAWVGHARDAKSVCDAILARLPDAGLRYGVGAWSVGQMLAKGGGYCGGWYRMFQAMAAAQGVVVERRSYLVDWREEPGHEARWCALVVRRPGIGRKNPEEAPSTFHDADRAPVSQAPLRVGSERRYRFWGHPGHAADGHCINFLRFRGRWFLYDACFNRRPVPLARFTLPRPDAARAVSVARLGTFKQAYLDAAVRWMLGSLVHDGRVLATVHPGPRARHSTTVNGLSVRTALIPATGRALTFYWTT